MLYPPSPNLVPATLLLCSGSFMGHGYTLETWFLLHCCYAVGLLGVMVTHWKLGSCYTVVMQPLGVMVTQRPCSGFV